LSFFKCIKMINEYMRYYFFCRKYTPLDDIDEYDTKEYTFVMKR